MIYTTQHKFYKYWFNIKLFQSEAVKPMQSKEFGIFSRALYYVHQTIIYNMNLQSDLLKYFYYCLKKHYLIIRLTFLWLNWDFLDNVSDYLKEFLIFMTVYKKANYIYIFYLKWVSTKNKKIKLKSNNKI